MPGKSSNTPSTENPGEGDDSGQAGGKPASSGLENPDAAAAGLEALVFEVAVACRCFVRMR